MSDGLAFLAMVATCVLFVVWARRPKADPPPKFTPAEDAPAFKDETGMLPVLACAVSDDGAKVVFVRPRKNGAVKKCPACKHRNRKHRCRAILRTERRHKTPLRCNCTNVFHHKLSA